MPGGQQAQPHKSPRRPVAPPVYRPDFKKIVQPKFGTIQRVLESPAAVDQYARSIHGARSEWSRFNYQERMNALRQELVPMFNAIGVRTPEITLLANDRDRNGEFDSTRWSLDISEKNLREKPLAELAKTLYHEARHAEQYFLIARLIVAKRITPPHGGQIPEHALKSAAAAPPLSPVEMADAQRYYDSIFGAGSEARDNVLKRLEAYSATNVARRNKDWKDAEAAANEIFERGKQFKEALKRDGKDEAALDVALAPIRRQLKDARERRDVLKQQFVMDFENSNKAQAAYRALPEEADAHARGDEVEERLKGLAAAPPPSSALSVPPTLPLAAAASALSPPALDAPPSLPLSPHATSQPIPIPGRPRVAPALGRYDATPPHAPDGGWPDTPPTPRHMESH